MFNHNRSPHLTRLKACLPLYFPWILSEIFQSSPITSYFIAWTGTFLIFYYTLGRPMRMINGEHVFGKLMRPICLIQIVFAGFMCGTSIFFLLDHLGFQYFHDVNTKNFIVNAKTFQIAACQRYCVLGHASLCTGIIMVLKTDVAARYTFKRDPAELLVPICIISFLLGLLTNQIQAFLQLALMLATIAQFTAAVILVKGLQAKRIGMIAFGGIVFLTNLLSSGLTGYKEGVIVNLLLLAFLLFPYYKKAVFLFIIPLTGIVLYILPTLASAIRVQSWAGTDTAANATEDVYLMLLADDPHDQIKTTNWEFLTNRFSELGMFAEFASYVPEKRGYYHLEILGNSLQALIPRAFWKSKPNTEDVSMERVYDAGVINRWSAASAKTRPIVDAYLSGGKLGIFLSMLFYGLLCQSLCNKAEKEFGGYEIGCVIVFNGIFQQLWRGNNFEFIINNIVYGYLLMLLISFCLKQLRILIPETSPIN
jgi:hypothetical protein